ncbi:DUF4222 domain-containing protein [Rouxiella badensis]|uniref:DUF4222 domain-containing protein n=1 Tax=Rouxiella badensis TaxID=1646377 RepID=A0A1X0WDK4_9GAMM|nr:DUF4222 domain-containing protein [Rouxiella badensis]ORJ24857.1 hypothetical protein BS640_13685 [Rouxiella badensis]WAT05512.1 DUF4222 domain-containing protein [Rouxiella badensis]
MKPLNTRLISGGSARPEIRPGDIWQTSAGVKIIISSVTPGRVTYTREGYEHPCISPVENFYRAYFPVKPGAMTAWCQENNPLEKVKKLKALIQAKQEGNKSAKY